MTRIAIATILTTACVFGCSTKQSAVKPEAPVVAAPTSAAQPLTVGYPISVRTTSTVKIIGAFHVDFPQGPSAVVINYETEIPVNNMSALAAQADDLMKFFQSDVEATGVTTAVL